MKHLNSLILRCAFSILLFSSCQKELSFPEPQKESSFNVVVDGKTYVLEVQTQTVVLNDTAILRITGSSPDITVRLTSKSVTHINGVGDYYLFCCSNDVFDRTTGIQKHFEGNRSGGGNQKGFIKITRMDETGYEGTYSITGQAGTSNAAPRKEFTGNFQVVY